MAGKPISVSKTPPGPTFRSNGGGSHSSARSPQSRAARAQPSNGTKRKRPDSMSTSPSSAPQRRKQIVTVGDSPPGSAVESDTDSSSGASSDSSSDSVPSSTALVDDEPSAATNANAAPNAVSVGVGSNEHKPEHKSKSFKIGSDFEVKDDDLAAVIGSVREFVSARDRAKVEQIAALTEQLNAEKDAHANSNSEYEMSAKSAQDAHEKQLEAVTGERDALAAKLADEQRAASNKIAQLEEKIKDASALHAQAVIKHAEKVTELEGQVAAAEQERDEERAASQSGKDRFAAGVLNLLNNHIPGYLRPNAPTN